MDLFSPLHLAGYSVVVMMISGLGFGFETAFSLLQDKTPSPRPRAKSQVPLVPPRLKATVEVKPRLGLGRDIACGKWRSGSLYNLVLEVRASMCRTMVSPTACHCPCVGGYRVHVVSLLGCLNLVGWLVGCSLLAAVIVVVVVVVAVVLVACWLIVIVCCSSCCCFGGGPAHMS